MMSSAIFTIASSSLVSYFFLIGTGSFMTSSFVVPAVVSFMKESSGRVLVVDLSTDINVIDSYFSSRAVSIN
jgi:hypothetical protein